MIFIDSNIPMYAAGPSSPQKVQCIELIKKAQETKIMAASSAEVLQEILHRYRAINRLSEGSGVYEAFRSLPLNWFEITPEDADYAKDLLTTRPTLSSRDAIHVAVMHRAGIRKIVTYDQGFLGLPSITVFLPHQV